MRTDIILVDRLLTPRHTPYGPALYHLRSVDMSRCNIVKARQKQLFAVDRDMLCISAVPEQNGKTGLFLRLQIIIFRLL